MDINTISIAAEIGMYFPVPVLGYMGDRHGQSKLALLSVALFTPSYLYAAFAVRTERSHRELAVCFALIGCATSALYVSTVVSCAKMFPRSTGFALSAPIAAYGISSLWEAQAIATWFAETTRSSESAEKSVDIASAYIFLAALLCFAGFLSFAAAKVGDVDGVAGSKSVANEDSADEDIQTQKDHLRTFLASHEMWLLIAAFVFTSGPLEMYLNNMGTLVRTVPHGPEPSDHLSIFSAFSTIARLTVGVFSDYVRPSISTAMILSSILTIAGVIHCLTSTGIFMANGGSLFSVSSVVNGFAYGAIFTLFPTMVARVWGVTHFGTNWGIFILGPAVGSVVYGLIFASVYDHAKSGNACFGRACYEGTFIITGTSLVIAAFVVFSLWQYSWKRNTRIAL